MGRSETDVIQGTMDLLILRTVRRTPLHGYGIGRHIEDVSDGVFKVNPGSLITALRRLERAGWLTSQWRETENGRRAKYYGLTAGGERHLVRESELWRRRAGAMTRLLATEA